MAFVNDSYASRKIRAYAEEGTTNACTTRGVTFKTLYFILLTLIGAAIGIVLLFQSATAFVALLLCSCLVTVISGIVALLIPAASLIAGSLYCLGEGVLLGTLSLFFEASIPGVVITAVVATIGTVAIFAILILGKVIRIPNGFVRFLMVFGMGLVASLFILWLLSLFATSFTFSFGATLLVSVLVCLFATGYLMLSLSNVVTAAESGLDKKYEWYLAFDVAYSVLYLYLQILRIVALFSRRNN